MTQKIIELLEKYGPMLSGKAAHLLEKEYSLSNSAARQILSRAKVPVRKYPLSLLKTGKNFYTWKNNMKRQFTTKTCCQLSDPAPI